ncbi:MAG: hypothetical protein E7568_06165 [Ruminococcaceae bacterium]|nr:hypothetical protein [Oscillospiraceae bacterium]
MKKILSFVLSLVLLFSLIPAGSIGVIANALSEYPVLSYGETVSFDLVGYETTKDYQFTPERTCDYNVYIYQSEEDSCSYKITVYYENGNIYDWYYSYGAYYFRFYLNAEETYRICVENQTTGTAHYELKVIEPPVADSITIDNDDRYPRFVGESEDIYTSQTPLGSIYAAKTWESTNESVVYVADYMLYFASEGTATITATTNNGLSDSKTFTVLSTTDISLNSEKVIDVSEHKGFAMFTFVPDTDGIYSFSVYNQQFSVGATVKDEYMYDIDSNISDSTFELQFEATANTQYYIKTVTYDENLVTGTYNVKLNKKVPASSVTIKPGNTLNLYRGMRYCLEAVLNPEGCINENIQWNSDNENVVEVDDWGEIKTVGIGSAVITARTENGLTDTLTVVVNTSDEIALDETKTNFVTADNPIGAYEFVPTENGYYRISVRCDDENYTSVNTLGCYEVMGTSGYVTSFVAQLEANEAYNIITTFFEEGNHSYSVKIEKLVPANSVVIGNGDMQGRVGEDFWLWVEFGPENHIEESYSFSSNNPAVADVTDDGWVQFISEGNTTITVTSENGLTNTINVTVLPQLLASSMKINGPEFKTAFVGIQECYSVDFEPMECSAEEVTWYSNDEEIATIDGGCINFLKEGTVIITAVSENGLVDSCTVQVKSMPVISPLNPVNISITNNQGEYMKYISDGNKTVRFYASDLSNDNEVKFEVYDEYYCWVAHGYDFVDLDVLDGDIYYIVADYYSYADMGNGSFKVNAVELVEAEDMNITSDTITGYEGFYEQLEVEFAPFNAITENVVWESGNQAIATVEGGTVKYISEGTTTITATSENGLVATATVTVIGATEIEVNEKKNDSVTQSVRGKSFKFTPEEDGCYQVKIDSEINLYVYVCATDSDEYLNYGWDYIMNLPVELEGGNTYLICAEPNWLAQQGDFEIIIEKMVPATSMEILEGESYYGYVGDTTMLSVSFNPENAIYEEITWESDNEDAVLVDEYGYIELLAEGEATVTATSENGLSATINIVSLSPKTITLNEDVDVLIDENVDSRRFKFTPQVTANYLLDINSDKVVEVWIENNDEDTYFSELAYESIVLELQAGVTYDIIAGYMANYTGSFTFKMSEAPEVTGLEIISLPYRMNYYAECMEFYYDGL